MAIWTTAAQADIPDPDNDRDFDRPQYVVIAGEAGLEIAIPAIYYWSSTNHQAIDWTLHWDAKSWR